MKIFNKSIGYENINLPFDIPANEYVNMESQKISYEQAFERLHRKRRQLALAQERQNAKKNK